MFANAWLRRLAPIAGRSLPRLAATASRLATAPSVGTVTDPSIPPYNGIVEIIDKIGNSWWQGSGVLLSPTEVLTASHVVFQTGKAPATDITVTADNEAATPGGSFGGFTAAAENIHYFPIDDANDELTFDQSETDYAVIHLSTGLYSSTRFGLLSDFQSGTATVSGYPATADDALVTATGPVSLYPGFSILEGPALGPGSSGGPVWVTRSDGQPYVVGLVSTGDANSNIGNNVQITSTVFDQIESWLAEDGAAAPPLLAVDTSLGQTFTPQPQGYVGPVVGLTGQYIDVTADNLNLTANTPNVFLHSGAGEDALQVLSGTNVLDGGTGSNFLVGGTGTDTFFTDDRAATADIWDTIANFHAGDAATVFGVTQADFDLSWVGGQGAAGYQGLTLHATSPDHAEASVTLAGFTSAALTNGQLTLSFGTVGGSPYLYIAAGA